MKHTKNELAQMQSLPLNISLDRKLHCRACL